MSGPSCSHATQRRVELAICICHRGSEGEIIAEGKNDASINPVLHGEIMSTTRRYAENIPHKSVYDIAPDLEFYATLSPAPCVQAPLFIRFSTVYYGTVPYISSQGLAHFTCAQRILQKQQHLFAMSHHWIIAVERN